MRIEVTAIESIGDVEFKVSANAELVTVKDGKKEFKVIDAGKLAVKALKEVIHRNKAIIKNAN